METQKRPLLRWVELGLFLFLAVAVVLWWRMRDKGTEAVLFLDGEKAASFSLGVSGASRIELLEKYGIPGALEIEPGRIRFVDVDCPDHICEKTGWISMEGESAVCIPNRASITIGGASPLS